MRVVFLTVALILLDDFKHPIVFLLILLIIIVITLYSIFLVTAILTPLINSKVTSPPFCNYPCPSLQSPLPRSCKPLCLIWVVAAVALPGQPLLPGDGDLPPLPLPLRLLLVALIALIRVRLIVIVVVRSCRCQRRGPPSCPRCRRPPPTGQTHQHSCLIGLH